ncbi:FtsX-like permease family protein [Micromonospora cremea]|uniref:Putative ABC transport system permease protein n=1 Tax=Micromonospora cremea TaxID=709881 RepID=A0A1N5UE45_9ACTN|nr:FtsX-like permease family protein [Micromonospora cremea]SIM58657.1 putative ABC transport system permease protein [Micromonospora cremea]
MIRQAFRANLWAFLGPAATQALAAALITTGLCLLASFDGAPLSPEQRVALTDSGVGDLGLIFTLSSVYLAVLIVGVTMGTAIADQARDLALVRTIGATPARVRRAIAGQAALVALPATAAGIPVGLLAGHAWLHGLVGYGVVPAEVSFRVPGGAVPIAYVVTVGTSLLGAMVAAIRPSRLRPAVALTEAMASRRGASRVRTPLGLLLVAGGIALAVVISDLDAQTADQAGLFVMLAMSVGMGLLGPVLLRVAVPAIRRVGSTGALAADSLTARAGSLSGALVPLTLAVAFAAVTIVRGTTTAHVTSVSSPAADRWLEYSGTGAYTAFAAIAAVNTLVTVMHGRRHELAVIRLAGGTRGRTLAIVICEALVVTSTALAAGAVVAATTLLPLLHTALGTWRPWLPLSWLVAGVAATLALVLAAMVVPAAAGLRRAPIEVVG